MSDKSHANKVAAYVRRLLAEKQGETGLEGAGRARPSYKKLPASVEESAFESDRESDLVDAASKKLARGDALNNEEAFALEAIILPNERPVIDIIGDRFQSPTQRDWRNLGKGKQRDNIEKAIVGVGRVNLIGHPTRPYSGTGFMVARHLLLTNRHVADDFSHGVGSDLQFIPGLSSEVDLKQEVQPAPSMMLQVDKVRIIHPHWDAALLEVSGFPDEREPLTLAGEMPTELEGRTVAAIGYPAFDPRNNVDVQNRVFRGVYYVKRLQPGKVKSGSVKVTSFNHPVKALTHDCSTLGGNSGSALVDVETGEVLGLHFAGIYLEENYAVPAWELALDPRVCDLGVRFSSTPPPGSQPAKWLSSWDDLESTTSVAVSHPPPPSPGASGLLVPPGWFERAGDEELARIYEANPEGTRRELVKVLGKADADDLLKDLQTAQKLQHAPGGEEGLFDGEEGFFWSRPDPELPELIFVHGIMGGHLAHAGFFRNRMWLDPKELIKGNLPEKMSLAADGASDAAGMRIEPDGHIRLKYAKAARKWRQARFVVHEFSFDWRKGVHYAAAALHRFIENRAAVNPVTSFVLVAHSMGGLVSSLYSQRYPQWQDRVERAVFLGSPLGGSYAVPIAITAQDDFIGTLAYWSRNDDHAAFAKMAASFPGLVDMLPHPDIFADAASLYRAESWPAGMAPRQRWLNQSRNLKPLLRNSPILGRTTLLVSLHHGTVERMSGQGGMLVPGPATGLGDGTVPARSALVEGVAAYKVNYLHGDLARDPLAIKAVEDLVKNGRTSLAPVVPADLIGSNPAPESVHLRDAATLAEARSHFEEGYIGQDDIPWLRYW